MKKEPIQVRILNREGDSYQIQFPYLEIPVTVNEQLYNKMLRSTDYKFMSSHASIGKTY